MMAWKKLPELIYQLEAAYPYIVLLTSPSEPTALFRQNATQTNTDNLKDLRRNEYKLEGVLIRV